MAKNAIGIHDPAELAAIAQIVPDVVKRNDCHSCLWGAAECRKGSMFEPMDTLRQSSRQDPYIGCRNWAYYD